MPPTNLTECLQWLDEVNSPDEGPAYKEWLKQPEGQDFPEFVASRVAECLRGHLAQKQQLDAVLKIQEDVQACAEKVDKITAKYTQAEGEPLTVPGPAKCPECQGKGHYPDKVGREPGESCNYCDGTGVATPVPEVSPAPAWTREHLAIMLAKMDLPRAPRTLDDVLDYYRGEADKILALIKSTHTDPAMGGKETAK